MGILVLLLLASSIGRSVIKGRTNGFEKHIDYLEQRLLTLGLRKEIGAEEIGAIKKKLSALCQDSRKDVLQVFQDLAGFLLLEQIQSCKGCNSLGTLCFGKRALGLPACSEPSKKCLFLLVKPSCCCPVLRGL